jgi:hypothetical protein
LPELERLPEIFTVSQIEKIANKAFKDVFRKRNRQLDIDILQAGIIEAASAYVLAITSPSRGEIKREIERILKLTKSNRNIALNYALRRLSQQTHEFIESRGCGPLPRQLSDAEPERIEQEKKQVILLCTSGVDGDGNYIPFVPLTQSNAPKRVAERDFILALRCTMFAATGNLLGRTEPLSNTGPLASLALECFKRLGIKRLNVALILDREFKRNWRW